MDDKGEYTIEILIKQGDKIIGKVEVADAARRFVDEFNKKHDGDDFHAEEDC